MSDYQSIQVLSKSSTELRIQVEEVHPDMPELFPIVHGGTSVSGVELSSLSHPDVIKFAAMLVFDEKGREGMMEILEDLEPATYVRSLRVESSEEIGVSSHDGFPLVRATLVVELASADHLAAFEQGETLGAAASVDGDFDECFG